LYVGRFGRERPTQALSIKDVARADTDPNLA
jgi:hypothetical protein